MYLEEVDAAMGCAEVLERAPARCDPMAGGCGHGARGGEGGARRGGGPALAGGGAGTAGSGGAGAVCLWLDCPAEFD